jgi:hypothetical protein
MVGQVRNYSQLDTFNKYWYRQRVVNKLAELMLEISQEFHREQQKHDELIDDDELMEDTLYWHPLYLPCHIEQYGPELFSAVIRFFGSWQNALNCSGLGGKFNSEFIRLQKNYWDQEKIIEHIRILYESRFDLSAGFIRKVYPELYFSAVDKTNFGTWVSALYEAEVSEKYLCDRSHRFWTLKRILQTIIEHEDCFGNIQPEVIRDFNPSMFISSRRYFKYWPEIVQKAGLNLKKNRVKVYLESFREYIVGEYLKIIYDKLDVDYKVESLTTEEKLDDNVDNQNQKRDTIPMIEELPRYCFRLIDGRYYYYVIPKFRSWCYGVENQIETLTEKFSSLAFYHSIGEPREWLDEKVRFENLNKFYSELLDNGEDMLVSELCLIARGGIPKGYQELFDKIMKTIMERIKS